MRTLVLASSSPYRRALLERLGLPYAVQSPQIDESPRPAEAPEALVARLAREKAAAVAPAFPDALIIGSDQVAVLEDCVLGKPGTLAKARAQLQRAAGKRVTFLTGLALLDSRSGTVQVDVIPYAVQFRRLDDATIARYVEREQPVDCAGSFKAEGLGVSLFEKMLGDDPNALIGLPLIRLVEFLTKAGVQIP